MTGGAGAMGLLGSNLSVGMMLGLTGVSAVIRGIQALRSMPWQPLCSSMHRLLFAGFYRRTRNQEFRRRAFRPIFGDF